LLATQLNSALIWGCYAAFQVGVFNYEINRTQIMKGKSYSLHFKMVNAFLYSLVYLEPLNLFLYTWRFLDELEQQEKNSCVKKCYKWFARISIVLVPTALICVVIAYIVELATYIYYYDLSEFKKAE